MAEEIVSDKQAAFRDLVDLEGINAFLTMTEEEAYLWIEDAFAGDAKLIRAWKYQYDINIVFLKIIKNLVKEII